MRLEEGVLESKASASFCGDETPSQPRLTKLLLIALTLWLSAAVTYGNALNLSVDACRNLAGSLAAFTLLFGSAYFLRNEVKSATPLMLLTVFMCGSSLALFEAERMHERSSSEIDSSGDREFALLEDLVPSGGSYEVLAELLDSADEGIKVRIRFNSTPGLMLYGERFTAHVDVHALEEQSEYSWGMGYTHRAQVYSYEKVDTEGVSGVLLGARRYAIGLFDEHAGNQAGILQALVCGYRGGIEISGEYEDYKIIGLAHVIAVSGSHLALVSMVAVSLAKLVRLPPKVRVLLVIALIASYFVFSGGSVSALRAVIMASASLLAVFAARRSSAQNALSICVLAFLLLDIRLAVSVSFALSAGSTLGLILFARLVQHWFGEVGGLCKALIVEPVSLTLASSFVTQLYSIALFSQFSIISIFANIVAAPMFSIGCVCGLAAALVGFACEAAAPLAVSVSAVSVLPMQLSGELLSRVPWASVPAEISTQVAIALTLLFCSLLYLAWPSRRQVIAGGIALTIAIGVFLFVTGVSAYCHDELVMLDVGQGDSFILKSEGACVMVDTGNRSSKLREALARNSIRRLDAVLITHADDDHCGCLNELSYMVNVGAVGVAQQAQTCACESCEGLRSEVGGMRGEPDALSLTVGDTLKVGNFLLKVVWPYGYASEGGNEDSLCLLVRHAPSGSCALLTGDAEAEQVSAIMEREGLGQIDVLKVGHHGSAGSISTDLLNGLSPELALISVGEGNWYGHPDEEVVDLLNREGSKVLRTDERGDVTLRFLEDSIRVFTQH